MSSEVVLSLCPLLPFLYAGLYTLADPASSIRFMNKLMADVHRLEANTLWGDLFAAPRPIADSRMIRHCLRLAAFAMVVSGLFRLFSL